MRIESSVTSLSWIPSEAVTGLNRAVFDTGVTHYDDPPPDRIDDLEEMRDAGSFRFANHLAAWVEVNFPKFSDGRGYSLARLLRERFGYRGELRAVGQVTRDNLQLLERCGFDALLLRDGEDPREALRGFEDFSASYQ